MSQRRAEELSSILESYHLSESDVLEPVSNSHLQEISRSHCHKWHSLPVALDMENHLIWEDIEREVRDEEGRRNKFFSCWQSEKGTDANYKSLINALLVIRCRQDAEYVCGLITETTEEPRGSFSQQSNLKTENVSKIRGCFASLVDDFSIKLKKINVDEERFRSFVAELFPGLNISGTATIRETFTALTQNKLWDHNAYSVFENIYKKFGEGDIKLKMLIDSYKAELAGFKATTTIIDFMREFNQSDNGFPDTEQDMDKTSYDRKFYHRLTVKTKANVNEKSLEYIDELWSSISEVFFIPSLPLVLESIRIGCTEITWVISTRLASEIESKKDTFQQIEEVTKVTLDGTQIYCITVVPSKMQSSNISSTLEVYHSILRPVSNVHLQEISRSYCRKWRSLPVALDMKNHLIWEDIDREVPGDEEGRRNKFFSCWKSEKGADATYKSLIYALREIGCTHDAKYVSGLLNKTNTIGEPEGSLIPQSQEMENDFKIRSCFASLVNNFSEKLKKKNVGEERFRFFVRELFPGVNIPDTATIHETFTALTQNKLWDYTSYYVFDSIYQKFGGKDTELKMLIDKYKAELAGFKATTKITDYIINFSYLDAKFPDIEHSKNKACNDKRYYRRLAVKTEKEIDEMSLEYIDELWKSISEVFHIPSLPLVLECVRKGSTEITWLISAKAAHQIESSSDKLKHVEVIQVTLDENLVYKLNAELLMTDPQEFQLSGRASSACLHPTKDFAVTIHDEGSVWSSVHCGIFDIRTRAMNTNITTEPNCKNPSVTMICKDDKTIVIVTYCLISVWNSSKFYYQIGTVNDSSQAIEWMSVATHLGQGLTPKISASSERGTVAVIYGNQESKANISILLGTISSASFMIDWKPPSVIPNFSGTDPDVAISDTTIVVVCRVSYSSTLQTKVGTINNACDDIEWGDTTELSSTGLNPSISINSKGYIIEIHQTTWLRNLIQNFGKILPDKTIEWSRPSTYTQGEYPTVSINNDNFVFEIHKSNFGLKLFYSLGKLQPTSSVNS